MVRLIVGPKGKGKTRELLSRVNEEIKTAKGTIVYLDKNNKKMFDLNRNVRLIDVSAYPIANGEQFVGFICGIISQDHDLQSMYLDSFLRCTKLEGQDFTTTILELDRVSSMFNIDFVISLTANADELADELKEKVIVAL